jgi:hypothetical protein
VGHVPHTAHEIVPALVGAGVVVVEVKKALLYTVVMKQ